jgi:y4mF family transcriptional regulator
MNEISNRIKESRKLQGMTQSELAMVSGCGLRFIVDLEAGKPTVQLNKVIGVLDALGFKIVLEEK